MTDTINKTLEGIKGLPDKEPMCRDCAADGPLCPNRQMPCEVSNSGLKALATRLERYEAALKHYGDTATWVNWRPHGSDVPLATRYSPAGTQPMQHGYTVARQALEVE